jgi:hypothetical protein
MLNVIMLNVANNPFLPSVVMLNAIMLNVANNPAECRYAKCHYAECRGARLMLHSPEAYPNGALTGLPSKDRLAHSPQISY